MSDRRLSEWYGVITDGHSRVTRLNLAHNGLTGLIPPELGNLSQLRCYLTLNGNDFVGVIQTQLSKLSKLESLMLRGSELSGAIPPRIGQLANLEWLDLSHNQLAGDIPPELTKADRPSTDTPHQIWEGTTDSA